MKNNYMNLSFKDKPITRFIAYLIVSILYFASSVCVGIGAIVLIIILLFGEIKIENSQLGALGILLFLPLGYLKKKVEKQLLDDRK